jgi:hypothetical protein
VRAISMTCKRSFAPTLRSIRCIWFFTVCSDRLRWDAISLLVRPRAIIGISSCCRRVSRKPIVRTLGVNSLTPARVSNKALQSWEGQTAWPRARARIAAITSSPDASFSRYPLTPARTDLRKAPSSASIPIMRTCALGFKSRIRVAHWRFKALALTESNKITSLSDLAIIRAIFDKSADCPITNISVLRWRIRPSALQRRRLPTTRKTLIRRLGFNGIAPSPALESAAESNPKNIRIQDLVYQSETYWKSCVSPPKTRSEQLHLGWTNFRGDRSRIQ